MSDGAWCHYCQTRPCRCGQLPEEPAGRPMSFAPRDGTPILGWYEDPGEFHVVMIDGGTCRREMDDDQWDMPDCWYPLPARPAPPFE